LHCGYTEKDIGEMSYIFYKDIIAEIAIDLQYNSVVHLLGRDYSDETVSEYVNKHNPFMMSLEESKEDVTIGAHKKVTLGVLKDFGMMK